MAWYPRLAHFAARSRSKRLSRLYMRAVSAGRLSPVVRILQRLHALAPITEDMLPDEAVENFRGCAESLRGNPLFARYLSEYLL
jgi:hypothetical protein